MWVDGLLRRYGIILLILTLPGLVVPVVAVAQHGFDGMSGISMVVLGAGFVGALALYAALVYFTIRAYRR